MENQMVRKEMLPWWAAGLLLGLVQILAVAMAGPLGVSTQFAIADAKIIQTVAPEYVQNHPVISQEKYQKFGYGWWLNIGLILGAFLAAILTRKFKISSAPLWWKVNHGHSQLSRFITCAIGGFLILLGARMAHGCTSGQFASGWAQLSLSAVPFTITMFVFGMIAARLAYPKTPQIEK